MFARSYIDVYGHVEYTSFAAVALQEVAQVTSGSRVPSVLWAVARHRLLASGTSLGTWLAAQPSTVSVIALSPPLALSIVHGYWQNFHAVAITNRTNFKRFPLRVLPSSKVLVVLRIVEHPDVLRLRMALQGSTNHGGHIKFQLTSSLHD